MKPLTPEQQRWIDNMMTGRRLRLRNPGPRCFPDWTPDMSTPNYVMQYRLLNLECTVFRREELKL